MRTPRTRRSRPDFVLTDGDEMALDHASFSMPPSETRAAVVPGDVVKLVVSDKGDQGAERMWFEVTESLGNGRFKGRLENEPIFLRSLAYGAEIEFETRHMIQVAPASPAPSAIKPA